MRNFAGNINQNLLGNIKYRTNIITGVIANDNGNYTYDVYLSGSTEAYPNIPTTAREPDFSVNDPVEIAINNGNKEDMIIIGLAKKVVQDIQVIDINTLVTTLDAYDITTSAYLEGRIEEIDGYENCLLRGFHYGLTTSYGLDIHEDGSYEAGSYSLEAVGLNAFTTYHFQAYVLDADGDEQVGEDKSFITSDYILFENQIITDNEFMSNSSSTRLLAYFFQAESNHTIVKIALYMSRFGLPGNVTLKIYPNQGSGNFKPVIGGGVLTEGITDGDTLVDSGGEWREFEVTPYSLINGTWYSIVIGAVGGDASNYSNWLGTLEDVLPNQWRHSSNDLGVNWYSGAFDFTYKIYG